MTKQLNACDGGHETTGTVKRLSTGGGSAVIVCKSCYKKEIAFRKQRNKTLDSSSKFDLPTWESLPVVE